MARPWTRTAARRVLRVLHYGFIRNEKLPSGAETHSYRSREIHLPLDLMIVAEVRENGSRSWVGTIRQGGRAVATVESVSESGARSKVKREFAKLEAAIRKDQRVVVELKALTDEMTAQGYTLKG